MSFPLGPWLARVSPKNPGPDPVAAGPVSCIPRTKAEELSAVCRSGARAGGSPAAPLLALSRMGCSNPLRRRPQMNSSPKRKSHHQRACYATPGRASVQEYVNNLILNYWASGVWLLFNSRGRPQKNSRAAGLDRFEDPGPLPEAKEVGRPWNRERSPAQGPALMILPPPRSHDPTANQKHSEPSLPLRARRQSKEPRSKLRGIDNMISHLETKPKQASGYQTQGE